MKKKKKVLLVGWDSADWKIINSLLDEGGMHGIRSLMQGGAYCNLATLEPQLSPLLWTSIATGKTAQHHGVHGFTEVDPISGSVVPVSAATRKCKTVWEILGESGLRTHIVSWFATQGEREVNGKLVSNMFGHLNGVSRDDEPEDYPPAMPGTYWPENLAEELNPLRVSPFEIDVDILQPFLPRGNKIDQERDRRINPLRKFLAESYSVHAAATYLMESDSDWDFMAVYYRAIDEISHHFMHYHPPKMDGIPEDDFEIYQHVVNATYRVHDMMLQRLMQIAGPEATVILVSDHGFHSDHLRPVFTPSVPAGITVWHRNQGVFIAKGAGIEATDEIYGAGLLDITPTILRLFDQPIGKDMEGRVLLEALTEKNAIESIPSWEKTPAKPKRRGSLSPEESEALLEQFVALGYINDIAADSTEAATETRVENQWSLARSLLYSGQHESALPLLEDCHIARPDRTDFAQALARTQLALGLKTEAEETLGICLRALGDTTAAYILQAHIAYEKGDHEEAIAHLETARAQSPQSVPVLELSCRAYVILKRWQEAWDTAELLLSIDPSSIQAHNILTRCHLRENNPEVAVETALAAIGLRFSSPRAHQLLGRALIELGRWEEAEQALHNALRFDLSDIQTLQALKTVYEHKGEIAKAMEFEGAITTAQFIDHQAEIGRLDSLRDGIAARAKKRHAERRASEKKTSVLDTKDQPLREMEFTLVSGLPRSGTSLMMQVLRAGGMELMHDGKRVADEDNPEGYWEWEGVKSLKQNPRLIEQAEGKVIKVISALLGHLPTSHRYRIVFMKRPAEEVVASQLKMLARNGLKPRSEREHLIQTQRTHLDQTLARLQNLKHVELLEVNYPDLVSAPEGTLQALEEFFGSSLPMPQNMSVAIRPELYRNQSS